MEEEKLNGAHELGNSQRKKLGETPSKIGNKRPNRSQPIKEVDCPFYDGKGKITLFHAGFLLRRSKLPTETINQIMRFVFRVTGEILATPTLLLSKEDFERAVKLTSMILQRQTGNSGGVEEVMELLNNLSVVEDNPTALDCYEILRSWAPAPGSCKFSPNMFKDCWEAEELLKRSKKMKKKKKNKKKDASKSATLDDDIAKKEDEDRGAEIGDIAKKEDEDSNKKSTILANES